MKINFGILVLIVFVTTLFFSRIDVLSSCSPAIAKTDIPTTDELANMTWDGEGVSQGTSSLATAGRLNATEIAQTNTIELDADVKTLVILIPDKRLITQNFLPLNATIVEGTNVIWVNGDKVSPHHITLMEINKMQPIFYNKTIPYQNGSEYTFDIRGTYKVSDPLNSDIYAPTGTINVIGQQYAPDNLSSNSTQGTVGLFVAPAEQRGYFDKHFNTLGYHVEDSYIIPGPEENDIQLYAYTQKSGKYSTILNRTATKLQILPFPDLVHYPFIVQNFKGTIKPDLFAEGLSRPTGMAFIDNATILVLEKDSGNIRKISDGILEEDPVLRVNVDSTGERGLLGIAVLRKLKDESTVINTNLNNDRKPLEAGTKFVANLTSNAISIQSTPSYCNCSVFIYFTQNNEDVTTTKYNGNSNNSSRNVIYKYDWDGKSLINSKLLVDLPVPPYHNGGKLKIGPDNQLYAVIGDLPSPNSILQNHKFTNSNDNNNVSLTNNSLVIIRLDPDNGFPSKDNPFVKSHLNNSGLQMGSKEEREELNYYYAYGIRNSFGLAFDPLTGKLWDTENGKDEYDEINLVSPGFNSGWHKIMGPKSKSNNISDSDLEIFKEAHYSDPAFSWKKAIGVTDIEFFNSSKLGNEYANNLYVGDINNGNLYLFKVNDDRSGLNFEDIPGIAYDLIADNKEEVNAVTVGTGFGGITDIETGPDGYLYILTYYDGRIYKITND